MKINQNIDIISLFVNLNINYVTSGKNVSQGWIGTKCPFCDDHSNHLGINIESLTYSCWKCGKKGRVNTYLLKHLGASQNSLKSVLNNVQLKSISSQATHFKIPTDDKSFDNFNAFYNSIVQDLTEPDMQYLHKRNITDDLIKKHELKSGRIGTNYRYRIIIPYFYNGKIVSFTSRATFDSNVKYLDCPKEKSIIPIKETLYNIDNAKNKVVVVEGAFKAIIGGDNFVATSTTRYTNQQIKMLSKFNKVIVFFDNEPFAQQLATNLANSLSGIVNEVLVVCHNKNVDFDEWDLDEIEETRKEILN